jgi:hypothetical protein
MDFPRRDWAHYHLVQNNNQVTDDSAFIPHWVQPGLKKRNSNRKGVATVGYSGQTWNGNLAGSTKKWQQLLDPYGIEFMTIASGGWHDMSSVDVLLAIRSFDDNPHNTKPPSKLFNAWHANIPFIGGNDSAYKQVGNPGKDYLIAKSPEEAVAWILRLAEDADFYDNIVQNGRIQSLEFNQQKISERWEEVLSGPVLERYQLWASRKNYEKTRFLSLLSVGLSKHRSKQLIKSILRPVKGILWI